MTCDECARPKCAFSGCGGKLLDASSHDYRMRVDSTYIAPVKGKPPPPPWPKFSLRHHMVCDTCKSVFYHLHEIEPVPVYEDGVLKCYVYPPSV